MLFGRVLGAMTLARYTRSVPQSVTRGVASEAFAQGPAGERAVSKVNTDFIVAGIQSIKIVARANGRFVHGEPVSEANRVYGQG